MPICDDFVYDDWLNSAIQIVQYTGNRAVVEIPEEMKGKPVAVVSCDAFQNQIIDLLRIPNSVKWIFGVCNEDSPGEIRHINIGSGCVEIGGLVRARNLQSIEVSPDNRTYTSVDGVLYNKTQTMLIRYPHRKASESFAIPDCVERIYGSAFYRCEHVGTVTVSKNIQKIDQHAFFQSKVAEIIFQGDPIKIDGAYSASEWAAFVIRRLEHLRLRPRSLSNPTCEWLSVYARASNRYRLVWDEEWWEANAFDEEWDWMDSVLKSRDKFDSLCKEHDLFFMFFIYNDWEWNK